MWAHNEALATYLKTVQTCIGKRKTKKRKETTSGSSSPRPACAGGHEACRRPPEFSSRVSARHDNGTSKYGCCYAACTWFLPSFFFCIPPFLFFNMYMWYSPLWARPPCYPLSCSLYEVRQAELPLVMQNSRKTFACQCVCVIVRVCCTRTAYRLWKCENASKMHT